MTAIAAFSYVSILGGRRLLGVLCLAFCTFAGMALAWPPGGAAMPQAGNPVGAQHLPSGPTVAAAAVASGTTDAAGHRILAAGWGLAALLVLHIWYSRTTVRRASSPSQALRRETEWLLENMRDGVCTIDAQGTVLTLNAALRSGHLQGLSLQCGNRLAQHWPSAGTGPAPPPGTPPEAPNAPWHQWLAQLASGQTVRAAQALHSPAGESHTVATVCACPRHDPQTGQFVGAIVLIHALPGTLTSAVTGALAVTPVATLATERRADAPPPPADTLLAGPSPRDLAPLTRVPGASERFLALHAVAQIQQALARDDPVALGIWDANARLLLGLHPDALRIQVAIHGFDFALANALLNDLERLLQAAAPG